MNTRTSAPKLLRGLTLIEVLLVIVVVVGLLTVAFVFQRNAKAHSLRMCCINNLKESQLSFIIWAGHNGDRFPMEVPKEQGGTLGLPSEGNAFRNFQVMSNELSVPIKTICLADIRPPATNFQDFNNQNISFFVDLDATQTNSNAWLCGDRNITNELTPNHSVLTVQSGQSPGWTGTIHNNCGNVALVDGSVHQWSSKDLRKALKEASWTNHLVLPE